MAACTFSIGGNPQQTDLCKISRDDLYGASSVRILGTDGKELQRAALPQEGNRYLLRGQVKRATKVGDAFTLAPQTVIDVATGQPKEQVQSAFKVAPEFKPATIEEAALFETTDVYLLPGVRLALGSLFKGHFNYRTGYDRNDAILIANQDGTFLLVGNFKNPAWVSIESDSQLLAAAVESQAPETEEEFSSLF